MNLEQRVGIFRVAKQIEKDVSVRTWRKEKMRLFSVVPTFVEEEIYSKSGISVKLKVSKRMIDKFKKRYGLLQVIDKSYNFTKNASPFSTLSIAQFTSFLFKEPIENILISEKCFKSLDFLNKSPEERIRILYNAYFGSLWFNSFYFRQKKLLHSGVPKVKVWQRISVKDLEDWFLSSNSKGGLLKKLRDTGFLIPRYEKAFRSAENFYNIVNPFGLAQLIALISDSSFEDILVRDDPYPKKISEVFVEKKVLPFLSKKNIVADKKYSLNEGADLAGINRYTLYQAAKRGAVSNVTFKKKGKTKILGIDLALFALKNTSKLFFSYSDLLDLFGTESLDTLALGMKSSPEGRFSKHHYVFPVYDYIASFARRKILRDYVPKKESVFVSWRGKQFRISYDVQKKYLKRYGLKKFDDSCLEHISNELAGFQGPVSNGFLRKIETEQLVFTFDDDEITDISMNFGNQKQAK